MNDHLNSALHIFMVQELHKYVGLKEYLESLPAHLLKETYFRTYQKILSGFFLFFFFKCKSLSFFEIECCYGAQAGFNS
jgi:hypothetical protein